MTMLSHLKRLLNEKKKGENKRFGWCRDLENNNDIIAFEQSQIGFVCAHFPAFLFHLFSHSTFLSEH